MTTQPIVPDTIILPPPAPGGGVSRRTINDSARGSERLQLTVAAAGEVEPIIYGTVRIGGRIGYPIVYNSNLLVPCFIGLGEIDAIVTLTMDNKTAPVGVSRTDYLGTSGQTANASLVAAWAAKGKTYTDTHANRAYTVVSIPPGPEYGFSSLEFTVRGKKVYDPRKSTVGSPVGTHILGTASTYEYSSNPALCLADLIYSPTYGLGMDVDWDSVALAASYCDTLLGTSPNQERRRAVHLILDKQQRTEQWVETLRSYAGVWLAEVDGAIKFVIDDAAATAMTLIKGSYRIDSMSIEQRGPEDMPTVVSVQYMDTSSLPWSVDATKEAKLAGVDAGTVPYRESVINWPGCQSAGQAYREAFRRLKQAQLSDLVVKITLLDDALRLYEGLVVELSDDEGFTSKPFRVTDFTVNELGRPVVELHEYDAAVYSQDYVTSPTNPDSSLPSPADPDPATSLVLTETLVQVQGSGLYHSTIFASWTAPDYPFVREYRVEITQAGVIQETGTARDTEYRSGPLKEGVTYAVNVYVVSTVGAVSAVLQSTLALAGKDDTPSDVTGFTGREVGGRVMFEWTLVDDLDNAGYELRYALASLAYTWDQAELLDTVPTRSNRYTTTEISAGDWRFYIKARDGKRTVTYPGGQYSVNAATKDIPVTLDTANFVSERVIFEGEALENMTEYTLRPDPAHYFVTDFLDTLGYGHTDTDDSTGTFDDLISEAFCVPHSAPGSPTPDSIYTSDAYDFGATINATWRAEFTYYNQDAAGPEPSVSVLISTNGVDYTEHAGEQYTGEGRYAKIRLRCPGLGTMLVVRDSTGPALTIDAVVRAEDGSVTTSASGPATVSLQNKYTRLNSIQITPTNSSAGSPTVVSPAFAIYDNVQLSASLTNTFDVYAFDENGNQIAVECSYTFKGV